MINSRSSSSKSGSSHVKIDIDLRNCNINGNNNIQPKSVTASQSQTDNENKKLEIKIEHKNDDGDKKKKEHIKENAHEGPKTVELIGQLPKLVQKLLNGKIDDQVECCRAIRKITLVKKDPPLDAIIDSGIVPHLIGYLKINPNNKSIKHVAKQIGKLQFEAAWILTNICASSDDKYTTFVVSHNAIKPLVNLILSSNKDVSKQAVWALGNIAGDSAQHRDTILSNNGLKILRHLQNGCIGVLNSDGNKLNNNKNKNNKNSKKNNTHNEQLSQDSVELLREVAWTLSNLCRGKTILDKQYIEDAVEALNAMLKLDDTAILQDTTWGFSYLTDNCNNININVSDDRKFNINLVNHQQIELTQLMKQCGALKGLVHCLGHREYRVRHPTLRALGSIVTGCDKVTQDVIDMGVCDKLLPLLDLKQYINTSRTCSSTSARTCDKGHKIKMKHRENPKPLNLNRGGPLLREACWMISNIAAGTEKQIDSVINSNIFPSLIKLLDKAPCEIRKEAAWAITNATSGGNKKQIEYLVHKGVILQLVSLLESNDPKVLLITMEALSNILKCGEVIKYQTKSNKNKFASIIEIAGGLERVEFFVYIIILYILISLHKIEY